MEGEKDPIAPAILISTPQNNDHFKYALDLFNHGYFWESHVYFEALWNTHGRSGPVAEFMKAAIKLGAAAIKFKLGQGASGKGHLARAIELLDYVKSLEGNHFLGFDLNLIIQSTTQCIDREQVDFKLIPSWS